MTKKIKDNIWLGVLFLYMGVGLVFLITTIDFSEEEQLYYKVRNDYIDCKEKFDIQKSLWIEKKFYEHLESEYCITTFEEWCKHCDTIMIKK